jgi:hypothetical protein
LITTCKWYDFIGFDLDVIKKLEQEFQVTWLEKTGYFLLPGIVDDPSKAIVTEFGIPIEKFVSNQQYIRFGIAIDILNANAKTVKYTASGKDLKSYIDIKNTKIGAFPYIFSTKKENLLIPGKLPDFTKIIVNTQGIDYSDLTSDGGIDLRIPKAGNNGFVSFIDENKLEDTKNEKTFQEIGAYYGYLENLYINFDFFKNTITSSNKFIAFIASYVRRIIVFPSNFFINF